MNRREDAASKFSVYFKKGFDSKQPLAPSPKFVVYLLVVMSANDNPIFTTHQVKISNIFEWKEWVLRSVICPTGFKPPTGRDDSEALCTTD